MRHLATFIDGELISPVGMQISPVRIVETREVAIIEDRRELQQLDPVDQVVQALAEIVAVTKNMDAKDQRRVRAFLATTQSVLNASGYLETNDQAQFQSALRSAIGR